MQKNEFVQVDMGDVKLHPIFSRTNEESMDICNQRSSNGSVDENISANESGAWFIWDVKEEKPDDRMYQHYSIPLDYRLDWSLETEEMFNESRGDLRQILCVDDEPREQNCEGRTHEQFIELDIVIKDTDDVNMKNILPAQ